MQLRPYQTEIIEQIKESLETHRAIIVQMPTGAGKSFIIGRISKLLLNNNKTCWNLVHRTEICDELVKQCLKNEVSPGQILAGQRMTSNKIQCGMLPTVFNRLKYLDKIYPDCIQLDECHHAVAKTHVQVINYKENTKIIGYSATPKRLDNIGLNNAGFTRLISGEQTIDLINQGYLSPVVLFSSPLALEYKKQKFRIKNNDYAPEDQLKFTSQKIIIEDSIISYRKYFNGNPCIVFCVSIKDCDLMAEEFIKNGWKAKSVHHKIPIEQRKQAIQDLEEGKLNILCSFNLFTEGISINILSGVLIRRLTMSLTVYLQQCGRVMRKNIGKKQGIIIDSAGNFLSHGHPLLRRTWNLEGGSEIKDDEENIKLRQCPNCSAWILQRVKICPYCNTDLSTIKSEHPDKIKIINEPLVEILPPEIQTGNFAIDTAEIMESESGDIESAIIDRMQEIKNQHDPDIKDRLYFLAHYYGKSRKWTEQAWSMINGK